MLWDEKDCVYCADKQNAAAVAEIQLPRHFLALDIVAMEWMKYQWGDQFGWLIGIKKGTA